MRILSFLLVLTVFTLGASTQSYANSKPWSWGWWPTHWHSLDFKPYLGDQKLSQRSLWDNDTWTPEAWIKDAGDEKRIIRDLYAADIIAGQYKDDNNIPVLKVGEGFMVLSGLDRRRILKFVDYVFEITSAEENGMFYVFYSGNKKDPLGVYNKHGFQTY